jgi:hypothetical protein
MQGGARCLLMQGGARCKVVAWWLIVTSPARIQNVRKKHFLFLSGFYFGRAKGTCGAKLSFKYAM